MRLKPSKRIKINLARGAIVISLIVLIQQPTFLNSIESVQFIPWKVLFIPLLLFTCAGLFITYYEYKGIGSQEGIVRKGPLNGQKYAALTFDDGPSPEYTPRILEILREHNVKATFFVTGQMVEKYPEIITAMIKDGHEIGNHSYNHFNLVLLNEKQLEEEIVLTDQAIEKVAGFKPVMFRPPRGIYSNRVREKVLEQGHHIVLWTLSALDWVPLGAYGIIIRVMMFLRSGCIILLHDGGSLTGREGANRNRTVAALPAVIKLIKKRDYKVVQVSQIVAENTEKSCLDQVS